VDEFAVEYNSFLMDNEPEHDMFDFNDACSVDFIIEVAFSYDTYVVSLDLKSLPNSLKYAFLGHDDSLPVVVASDLNQDQDEELLNLLGDNKETLGWTLGKSYNSTTQDQFKGWC